MSRIAIIVQHLRNGGAEHSAAKLATAMHDYGWKVDLIVFCNKNQQYSTSAPIVDLNIDASNALIPKVLGLFARYFSICRLRQRNRYDLVISFLLSADLLNVLSAPFGGRTVVTVRNFTLLSTPTGIESLIQRFVFRIADVIVAQTTLQVKSLVDDFRVSREKIQCIPNSFAIEKIRSSSLDELPPELNHWFSNRPTLVIIGRISMQKGLWNVIALIHELKKRGANFNLAVIGSEDEPEVVKYCKALVSQYSLENEVRFLGTCLPPYPYIRKGWALILPSFFEGFPNVLLEAMSLGSLVLASDCPSGPAEILQTEILNDSMDFSKTKNGLLLPIPDFALKVDEHWVEFIAEAILKMRRLPEVESRLRAEAQDRALSYSSHVVNLKWKSEFERILSD